LPLGVTRLATFRSFERLSFMSSPFIARLYVSIV
jgi:hypothetical protein